MKTNKLIKPKDMKPRQFYVLNDDTLIQCVGKTTGGCILYVKENKTVVKVVLKTDKIEKLK